MKYKGQAIVEVIIAIAVAMVAVLGLVQVATKSVANAGAAKRAAQATSYAMEGMEWVTGQKFLTSWGSFVGKSNYFCINSLPSDWESMTVSGQCGGTVITGTEFWRYVNLAPAGNESVVTVTVAWNEGSRVAVESQTSRFTAY